MLYIYSDVIISFLEIHRHWGKGIILVYTRQSRPKKYSFILQRKIEKSSKKGKLRARDQDYSAGKNTWQHQAIGIDFWRFQDEIVFFCPFLLTNQKWIIPFPNVFNFCLCYCLGNSKRWSWDGTVVKRAAINWTMNKLLQTVLNPKEDIFEILGCGCIWLLLLVDWRKWRRLRNHCTLVIGTATRILSA